mgnify:CR=1 FL=1
MLWFYSMKSFTLLLTFSLLSQSCATMFTGTNEKIHLNSQTPGTQFYTKDQLIGTETATLVIPRKELKGTRIYASKAGCEDVYVDVQTEFNETTLLGLFLDFGIVSILIVDWLGRGAVTEASRTLYHMNPICPTTITKL